MEGWRTQRTYKYAVGDIPKRSPCQGDPREKSPLRTLGDHPFGEQAKLFRFKVLDILLRLVPHLGFIRRGRSITGSICGSYSCL